MKQIKLAFSTTNGFGSAFLRWVQRCEYSHVEAVFDDYTIGAKLLGGVKVRPLEDTSKVMEYAYIDCTDMQYEEFYLFMHSVIGAKYDIRAYIGFLFFRKDQDKDRWFCSELILEALEHAGIKVLDRTPSWFCEPRDLLISPLIMKEGGKPWSLTGD